MRVNLKIICVIIFFILGLSSFVYADSERDIAIDQAIAGMEEGSRMLAPDSLDMPGTALSPAGDTKVIISPAAQKEIVSPGVEAQGGNFPGGVVSGPQETSGGTTEDIGTGTDLGGPSQEPSPETTTPIIDIDAGVDTDTGTVDADLGVNPGGEQIIDADLGGTEIDVGVGGEPSQEPTVETSDPIIDVDAGVDPDSGTVDADVGVNPSGDQLLDADIIGSEIDADIGTQEPSAETTDPIIDVDAGVDADSGTIDVDVGVNPSGDELLEADIIADETQIDIGSAVDIPIEDDIGDAEEPTEETSPIIDIDVGADLDSGTVDADLGVNPSGDQLLDADVGGTGADTTGAVEADIGTISDLIEPTSTIVAEPVIVAPPAGLSAEIDTTGETVGDETEVGIEADVSGMSAGEDIVDDPTDDGVGGF